MKADCCPSDDLKAAATLVFQVTHTTALVGSTVMWTTAAFASAASKRAESGTSKSNEYVGSAALWRGELVDRDA